MNERSENGAARKTAHRFEALTAISAAVLLSACGGGGGGGTTVTPPPVVPNLVLTGTAATGAALAGATVDAKCAPGSGTATTGTDGSFTITIPAGALPCVLRATSGAVVLHSAATTGGAAPRANITPVTELAVARHAGELPAAYYAAFDGARAAALTDAAVQAAATATVDTLKAGGVDFNLGVNVLNGPLVAKNGAVVGDAYDQRLDALKAAIAAAGVTLAELSQAVASGSPAAPVANRSDVASLPADLLLAPAAPNCPSLRSGRYRIIVNADGGTAPETGVITLNAPALTLVNTEGATEQLIETAPCTYTNADGGEVFVNKAGFGITRVTATGPSLRGAVFFPEQAHTVAELAGEYNTLAFDRTVTNGPIHMTSSTLSISATGTLTALNFCDDLRICVVSTAANLPNVTFTSNAAGGFNLNNATAGYVSRTFAYRAGGGELMLVDLATPGHITFMARNVAAVALPVGRIRTLWNLFLDSTYSAPAPISLSRSTITSSDAATGAYTRAAVQNFATGATRPESLQANSLRSGYVHRTGPVGVVHSDGTASTVAEFIALPFRGMDFSVLALPASNQFGISPLQSSSN